MSPPRLKKQAWVGFRFTTPRSSLRSWVALAEIQTRLMGAKSYSSHRRPVRRRRARLTRHTETKTLMVRFISDTILKSKRRIQLQGRHLLSWIWLVIGMNLARTGAWLKTVRRKSWSRASSMMMSRYTLRRWRQSLDSLIASRLNKT